MYTHVEILALGKVSDVDKTVKVLRGLGKKIDEVAELEVAAHEQSTARAGHIALIVRFSDRDDYETFQQHPEYAKTKQYLERVNAKTVHVAYPAAHAR